MLSVGLLTALLKTLRAALLCDLISCHYRSTTKYPSQFYPDVQRYDFKADYCRTISGRIKEMMEKEQIP